MVLAANKVDIIIIIIIYIIIYYYMYVARDTRISDSWLYLARVVKKVGIQPCMMLPQPRSTKCPSTQQKFKLSRKEF